MQQVSFSNTDTVTLKQVVLNTPRHVTFTVSPTEEVIAFIKEVLRAKKDGERPGRSRYTCKVWYLLPEGSTQDDHPVQALEHLLAGRCLNVGKAPSELVEDDCVLIH